MNIKVRPRCFIQLSTGQIYTRAWIGVVDCAEVADVSAQLATGTPSQEKIDGKQ